MVHDPPAKGLQFHANRLGRHLCRIHALARIQIRCNLWRWFGVAMRGFPRVSYLGMLIFISQVNTTPTLGLKRQVKEDLCWSHLLDTLGPQLLYLLPCPSSAGIVHFAICSALCLTY